MSELFGGKFNLPVEFTYSLLASFAAVISFATVRLNVKFSYYIYMVSKNSSLILARKSSPETKKYRNLLWLLIANFIMPVFVTLLFIKPLLETFIVPTYLEESTWRVLRVAFIVMAICLRMLTFREEL